MKKTDIHLHLTFEQHPKTEHIFGSFPLKKES